METFVTPDGKWLHGVEDGTEYCLGRPSGIEKSYGSWDKWRKVAREVLKINAPDTYKELTK